MIDAASDGMDVFEIGAAGDKVEIAGNSATAMTYGLQWYFKKVLHTQTDWDNHQLLLPKKLPKVDQVIRQQRTSKYSYYQNVCTVSYSSWTWGWPQWEKHIDWMALNGASPFKCSSRLLVATSADGISLISAVQESTCHWRSLVKKKSGKALSDTSISVTKG